MMLHACLRNKQGKRGSRRFGVAVALAVALALGFVEEAALATEGPGCTSVVCPDNDGDGFNACACLLSSVPCDCNDSDPNVYPGAPEACDVTGDRDCKIRPSTIDGGAPVFVEPCPSLTACLDGVCVDRCVPQDDFGCPGGSTLGPATDAGPCLCIPLDCSVFGCPPGQTCDQPLGPQGPKACVPTCGASVRCPFGQTCRPGAGCVDPCAGIDCPLGGTCRDGHCVASCGCTGSPPCGAGETCDMARVPPACVDAACAGVACPAGQHCEKGACFDDCKDVVCPATRVCQTVSGHGECRDLCSPNPCPPASTECDWRTGKCIPRPVAEGGLSLPPGSIPGDDLVVVGAGWILCSSTAGTASSFTSGVVVVLLSMLACAALLRLLSRDKAR